MPIYTAVMLQCSRCRKMLITSVQRGTNPQYCGSRDLAHREGWHTRTYKNRRGDDWCPECWDVVGPEIIVARDKAKYQRHWARHLERWAKQEVAEETAARRSSLMATVATRPGA